MTADLYAASVVVAGLPALPHELLRQLHHAEMSKAKGFPLEVIFKGWWGIGCAD